MGIETVARGHEGVVSHATTLSEVDGQAGRLIIRGYDVKELVGRASFEEAAHLLWRGDLPTEPQLRELRMEMSQARELPAEIKEALRGPAGHAAGMHALRVTLLGCTPCEWQARCFRLTIPMPTTPPRRQPITRPCGQQPAFRHSSRTTFACATGSSRSRRQAISASRRGTYICWKV